jgi:hypothetical protein
MDHQEAHNRLISPTCTCNYVKFGYVCPLYRTEGLLRWQSFTDSHTHFHLLEIPFQIIGVNPLTLNDLRRRRAVIPLKIKIPSKNMREKPTNATIIHSSY